MEEYLRKRYLGKEPKKDKRNKRSSVKIYDSEEEERRVHSHIGDAPLEDDPFVVEESDESSDIPITVTGDNNTEIVHMSIESKKKILQSLKGELTRDKLINEKSEEVCKASVKKLRKGSDRCSRRGKKGGSTNGSSKKEGESSGADSQSSDFSRHGATAAKPKGGVRGNRSGSDSDLSPPRRLRRGQGGRRSSGGSDSDLSPPRRSGEGGRRNSGGSDSDLSPPRRLKSRRTGGKQSESVSSSNHSSEDSIVTSDDREPQRPWGKGKKTQAGTSPEKKEKQNMESTIYRDKGGKIISREEWISTQKKDMNTKYSTSGKKGAGDGEEEQDKEKEKKKKKKN
ncbi:hypothetical protein AK88_02787 [Plasmodium fragile]|uniref:Uncharacterized protein n=1 Tax=Plasmodium fragile TaxID=5857 RepID=A0A0D9QKS9_PLAFR|nr:uncharacterized protein AK88_02787 [Plasmodium fragile]KJP87619.1 hypothetical protein AK88_02787 [Plasmodium fragile]